MELCYQTNLTIASFGDKKLLIRNRNPVSGTRLTSAHSAQTSHHLRLACALTNVSPLRQCNTMADVDDDHNKTVGDLRSRFEALSSARSSPNGVPSISRGRRVFSTPVTATSSPVLNGVDSVGSLSGKRRPPPPPPPPPSTAKETVKEEGDEVVTSVKELKAKFAAV